MAAAVETTINSREMPPVLENADIGTGCRDKNMEITFTGNTGNDVGISTAGYRTNKFNQKEWRENNYALYLQSFKDRENSEKSRNDATNLINSTEATLRRIDDVTKKLGERILDISFWKFELERVIQDLLAETDLLIALKKQLENAYRATELPLHIVTDNLNCRFRRQGIDLVEDPVEMALLKEMKIINDVRDLLKKTIARAEQQIEANRDAKQKLEMDWSDKKEALEIDNRCGMLRDHHTDKQFYPGSAKFQENQSSPESWAQHTHDNIIMAENERMSSIQLQGLIQNILEDTSKDMVEQHNNVLKEFQKHLQELDDSKFKLQTHLKKICREISDAEKSIEDLNKAIRGKEDQLKKAQTRLEARSHRPGVELCRDIPQYKLISEVDEINNAITALTEHRDGSNQLKNLQDTRMCLEKELSNKINSIFIDRQKCLTVRERYPSSLRLKGLQ